MRRLNQDVDVSIQRQIREILRSESDDVAVIRQKEATDLLRLRPPEIPRPFPPIDLEDVRLIAWIAIHP